MTKKLLNLVLIVTLCMVAKAQTPTPLPIDKAVRYGKLKNGLTYYIRHNAYPDNRADFYIAQRVGSMQEEDNQAGLAHFLEHMAFNGSKNYPGRKTMLNFLENNGAKFGLNVNAYTSFDETVYNLSDIPVVREGIVDSCLLVLHDWSGFLSLENDEIDKERAIIKEEWRTRGNAQMRIWEHQLPILFGGSKYAKRLPIGSMEVVEKFEYQTLKDYYNKWYRPDLQAIIIVGDIDAEEVERKVKALFSDIVMPANPAERIFYPVPDNEKPIVAISTDPEQVTSRVTLFLKHDVIPDDVKKTESGLFISLTKGLISQMFSDRLSEISTKADAPFGASVAYDDSYFVSKTKDAWTSIAINKEGKVKETLATLIRENERVRRFGFTNAELERAKAMLVQSYENAYNNRNKEKNNRYATEYVNSFIDSEAIPGIEFGYNFAKQFAEKVNMGIVNQIAKELINDKNVVIAITGPQKEGIEYPTEAEILETFYNTLQENLSPYEENLSNEPIIASLPTQGEIIDSSINEKLGTVVWTLSNGIKVIVKKTDFKDDQILMNGLSYGGMSTVEQSDVINAQLASSVPQIGGLGNFSTTDLNKVLAGKTASVNTSIDMWNQYIKGSSSIKDVETLLQLTYLHFTAPRKDTEAFTSFVEMAKNQFKNVDSDPNYIFSDSIANMMYGNNEYARNIKLADIERLDYDRIIDVYKKMYANPSTFVFTFVGNIDDQNLKTLVKQYLASLPAGNTNATYRKIDYSIKKGIHSKLFSQKMQTPKTSVFKLYSGTLERSLKNQISLSALKQILEIVYLKTVRENEGGTYGVNVDARINRIPAKEALLEIYFDTDPKKTEKLAPIIDHELNNIATNGPADEDLNKVKEYMNKQFEQDIQTNEYWSSLLGTYFFYNEDRYSEYTNQIETLTKEDIQQIAKSLLAQKNSIEIIMNPNR